jgi:hypothetical protein
MCWLDISVSEVHAASIFFNPEDGASMLLQKIGIEPLCCMVQQSSKLRILSSLL